MLAISRTCSTNQVFIQVCKRFLIVFISLFSQDRFSLTQDQLSAADVCLFAALYPLYANSKSCFENFSNLNAWFTKLHAEPPFGASVAKVTEGKGSSSLKASILAQPLVNTLPVARSVSNEKGKSSKDKENSTTEVRLTI